MAIDKGLVFDNPCICVEKVMRGGTSQPCGVSPTAWSPTENLYKCLDHHPGVPQVAAVSRSPMTPGQSYKGKLIDKMIEHREDVIINRHTKPAGGYERELKLFTDAMRYKLEKNTHRGKWEDLSVERALELLKVEVLELERAIKEDRAVEILLEGADIANYALIVANIALRREV